MGPSESDKLQERIRELERDVRDLERGAEVLRRHLHHLGQLIKGDANEVVITCGESSIRLTKTDVQVKGGTIEVAATRNTQIKASGNLVLKGGKILEN